MNDKSEKIDFVILWVDGSDKNWLAQKNKYLKETKKGDARINRFRDFGTLKYLFRGIEKYASWVNKIFFVTWGHIPSWLNVDNDKLRIVKHEEFIPKKYLPTFNSNVIELNLHRIEELSDKFVLFNDDIFLINNVNKRDFFNNGLPNDFYIEYIKQNPSTRHEIMKKNYFDIIKKYYDKQDFVRNYRNTLIHMSYKLNNIKVSNLLDEKDFFDIYSAHLTQPFLKETFKILWEKENDRLDIACKNKFRSSSDLGQALCRYFQLFSGKFYPCSSLGNYFELSDDNSNIEDAIINQKYKIICINDAVENIDFDKVKKQLEDSFNKILNKKSDFEI